MNTGGEAMEEGELIRTAVELTKALNRMADEELPGHLAGIVKLHAGIAVGSAFIPIPGADMVAVGANIWTMYVRINKDLELPFGENMIRSLAAGVMTNLGSAAAGYIVAESVLKFVPGLGSIGGAVLMAATIYSITIAAGIVYMKAVTKLLNAKSAHHVSEEDLKAATDEVLKDKNAVRRIIKTAKKNYQETRKAGAG
jgi:uncharacterized protein (DUF697 family)